MKTISGINGLEEFGIVPLTGEADNLSFRCLCDLTAQGKRIVEDCFAVSCLTPNWNGGSESNPHVASVMIPFDGWQGLAIIALALCCHTVLVTERGIYGLQQGEFYTPGELKWNDETDNAEQVTRSTVTMGEHIVPWPEKVYGKVCRIIQGSPHPHRGTRNVHAMSGRSV